jgi:hypothetical protein
MSQSAPPFLFVAFANPDNPAGDAELARLQLGQEAQNIYAALAPGEEQGGWQFLNGAETTYATLIDSFTTNRIVLFHYGGHSNGRGLYLPAESPEKRLVDGTSLDNFLANQHCLQLAFFNSCENNAWAQKLAANVPYVVATFTPVLDDAAVTFSNAFYHALSQEQNTVEDAFEIASNAVKLAYPGLFSGSAQQNGAPPTPTRSPTRSTDELMDDAPPQSSVFPWVLHKSPSAQPWRLADSAADPLVGMPSLPQRYWDPKKLPDCPYVTIKGHTSDDAALFFGRNDEIRRLYDWVFSTHAAQPGQLAQPILLFYGQSGAGKSSLLNAGLLPRLGRPDAGQSSPSSLDFPVAYRRRNLDLIDDLHSAIAEVVLAGTKVTPPANPDIAWWNSLVQQWLARTDATLVILDQLEEAITHFVKPQTSDETARYKTPLDEIEAFVARVKEIFAARPANSPARLLLSFRKEYLAEISGSFTNGEADDSSDLVERFWLDRLGPDAIAQIVTGPADSRLTRDKYKIAFPDRALLAPLIAGELLRGDSPIATVLEILLNQMWKLAKLDANGARIYSTDLYKSLDGRDNPLQGFYDQAMDALEDRHNVRKDIPDVSQGLELDLLYEHTSEYGTSIPVPFSTLRGKYPDTLDIPKLLDANKDLYLLVEPATEPGGSKTAPDKTNADATTANATTANTTTADETTALAHDTLARVVRHNFLHSSLPGPRARRILEGRVLEWGEDSKKGALLDSVDLKAVSRGLPHMRLPTKDEKKLLAASRAYRRNSLLRSFALMLLLPVLLVGGLVYWVHYLREAELTAINDTNNYRNGDSNQRIEVLAIAESLEAVRIQQKYSFLLRLDFTQDNKAINQTILDNLHQALALREVYRVKIPEWVVDLDQCAVTLDEQDRPLVTSLNGATLFHGHPIPNEPPDTTGSANSNAPFAPNNPTIASLADAACDPASRTIVMPSPDLKSIFVTRDGITQTWGDGKTILQLPEARTSPAAINPGGTELAYGVGPDTPPSAQSIAFLDLSTGKLQRRIAGLSTGDRVAFSPSGRYLVQDGGKQDIVFIDRSQAKPTYSDLLAPDDAARAPGYVGGQEVVALGGKASGVGVLQVRRLSDGKLFVYDTGVYSTPNDDWSGYSAVALSPDGRLLASYSKIAIGQIDLWDVPSTLDPLENGIQSLDPAFLKMRRRGAPDNEGTPTHLDSFSVPVGIWTILAISPDLQFVTTAERQQMAAGGANQEQPAYIHVWTLNPYTPKELEAIKTPMPLFAKGCGLIGNFIDDMIADSKTKNPSMLPGTANNIDYQALSNACKAEMRRVKNYEKANDDGSKAAAGKPGNAPANDSPANRNPKGNPDRNPGNYNPGRRNKRRQQ